LVGARLSDHGGTQRLARDPVSSPAYVPASVQLSTMLDRAEGAGVSIGWLMEKLGRRSFGLTLFVMAVIGLIPGASTVVGVLVAWPAVQMMLGQEVGVLPRLIARRKIGVERLAQVIRLVTPRLAVQTVDWLDPDRAIEAARDRRLLLLRRHARAAADFEIVVAE
jgi:hypothetical protein